MRRGSEGSKSLSHIRAKKQERSWAKRIPRARLVSGSGSGPVKGDVRSRRLVRIECKTTKNRSFSVTMGMIDKIENAALAAGEVPVIVVEFNQHGRKVKEVAIVPTYMLDRLHAA